MQDDDNKNLVLATVLSMIVLMVWFVLFPPEQPDPTEQPVATADGTVQTPAASGSGEIASAPTIATTPSETRTAALGKTQRLPIKTDRVEGSLSLTGARIDDLKLLDYLSLIHI